MANKRLIDADALRTDTMAMCGVNEAVLENCYPYWQFNKAIVNAPTIDAVEVKHGRWIETEEEVWHLYQRRTITRFRCSQCEQTENKKSNYCPNCGADMRKDDGNG